MSLTSDALAYALTLGFDRAAVLPAGLPRYAGQFAAWLDAGYHGEMAYLAARAAERLDPARLAPDAASMIVVAADYALDSSPQPPSSAPQGRIARYARYPDYHEVIKPKLFALDAFIRERTGRGSPGKTFVDSAPVLERDYAEQAGLGFVGRNTCLITSGLGSWTFLAGLLVPERLETGSWKPETGNWKPETLDPARPAYHGCGRCMRCLEACPTRAFVAPYVLDARRCISYLTIELRGAIPRDLRPLMGGWVFGCDVCQEVCPYNRKRGSTQAGIAAVWRPPSGSASLMGDARDRLKPRFQGRGGSASRQDPGSVILAPDLPLADLLALDDVTFRARFRGTPVLRAKRRGLVRNACVAAGNTGDPVLVPALIALLSDPESLTRGHAAWALGRIGGLEVKRLLANVLAEEATPWVQEEIASAIS